ncbi:nickel/cobalt ABC transporter permease [Desulfonatronum sp. SC1]|uniref:nickel/cobalt ABC transporter permease n=1 Tax=Desulfonatronum sp. SC1 TaxID=2109626 RepID=UPI000D30387B|nr:nickel/cobalt ABC transporter permease [Desulfonatronum sp. SC1]PTN38626.1 nickel ABC transporter permease subunit NikB [Desulfonatronum sp. SC1]
MLAYIVRRALIALAALLAISFLSYTLVNFTPADPAEVALRVNDIIPTPEAIEEMRTELGLDDPFLVRYVKWLGNAARLDFGNSFTNRSRSVSGELARAFPYTATLAGMALVFVIGLSLPLGVACAVWKDGLFDRGVRLAVFAGTSMPNYWLAYLLIWLFALKFNVLPSSGTSTLAHYILPAMALSTLYIATYVRLIRNSMLENMKENHVLYARARGLSEKRVILGHVLKNSLQSSMTAIGVGIVRLLSGTVVIENIFAIPGLGRLCVASIFNRDYPTIQAYILVMGAFFVLASFLVDALQCALDPRRKAGTANA